MITYMRTIVELSEEHLKALGELCRREKISRAEAIRRAVAEYARRRLRLDSDRAFGLWRERDVEGLTYERRLRREW